MPLHKFYERLVSSRFQLTNVYNYSDFFRLHEQNCFNALVESATITDMEW